jgi:hypothetical protein
MEAQLTDVRAELLGLMAVKPDAAQFGRLGVGATLETRNDSELASRLAVTEAELKGLKATVDELRQARDARQGPTGRETRQMAIRWKQGLLRFWIVVSVFWIASAFWFAFGAVGPVLIDYAPFVGGDSSIYQRVVSSLDVILYGSNISRFSQAVWSFGPPIATLMSAYIIEWIVRGFRPRKGGQMANHFILQRVR